MAFLIEVSLKIKTNPDSQKTNGAVPQVGRWHNHTRFATQENYRSSTVYVSHWVIKYLLEELSTFQPLLFIIQIHIQFHPAFAFLRTWACRQKLKERLRPLYCCLGLRRTVACTFEGGFMWLKSCTADPITPDTSNPSDLAQYCCIVAVPLKGLGVVTTCVFWEIFLLSPE